MHQTFCQKGCLMSERRIGVNPRLPCESAQTGPLKGRVTPQETATMILKILMEEILKEASRTLPVPKEVSTVKQKRKQPPPRAR